MSDIISEIISGKLYLTGIKGAQNVDQLKEKKIRRIVSIVHFEPHLPSRGVLTGIQYFYMELGDTIDANITKYFRRFYHIVHYSKHPVLVHCQLGMSRSATLILSYLLRASIESNLTLKDIDLLNTKDSWIKALVTWLKNLRPIVCPNPGFLKQLDDIEKSYRIRLNM
jgi:predicted protein tyrosine phosphatase